MPYNQIKAQFHNYYHNANGLQLINYKNKITCIGSCFAENIGEKLKQHRFNTSINPLGITFNPLVIAKQIDSCIKNENINHFNIATDGVYYNYLAHSKIIGKTEEELNQVISDQQKNMFAKLLNCNYLLLTWGSAHYYYNEQLNSPVANCHKQAQTLFNKQISTHTEIVNIWQGLVDEIKNLNPHLHVLISVSPVKYLKDGIIENNLSKSHLIIAAQTLAQQNDFVHYFPAYEIVTDILRDYMYYKADGVHPNEIAIDQVWETAKDILFDSETKTFANDAKELISLQNHIIQYEHTTSAKNHIKIVEQKIKTFNEKYRFNT